MPLVPPVISATGPCHSSLLAGASTFTAADITYGLCRTRSSLVAESLN